MKQFRKPSFARAAFHLFLASFICASLFSTTRAQQTAPTEETTEPDAIQRRITRARTLAAVGKLAAAATELESLSASTADDSVRDVARILLINIFVEMPDYGRAAALLEEAYKARSANSEASIRSYYALAAQTIKSVRTHIERYRTFGINVADDELPSEAKNDLDHLRTLLERVCEQARALREEEAKEGVRERRTDALALIEDAANARLRLARGDDERVKWAQEVSDARQRLFASETRVGKVSDAPVVQTASIASIPGGFNQFAPTSQPATASTGKSKGASNEQPSGESAKSKESAAKANANVAEAKNETSGLVSVGPLQGKAEKRVDPSYPQIAKMARISGVVTVYVVVDEKGNVESVQRLDGPTQLQSAAKDAVRRWRFKPTVINGQPVRVSGYISFNFAL